MKRINPGPKTITLCVLSTVVWGCQNTDSPHSDSSGKVIYGDDTRSDRNTDSHNNPYQDATVALLAMKSVDASKSNHQQTYFKSASLKINRNLCEGQAFAEQPTAAFFSGFLLDETTVVTAGHCLPDPKDCHETAFAFGYYEKSDFDQTSTIDNEDIYHCESLEYSQAEQKGLDFAIVKLNRPVTGRQPLDIRLAGEVSSGDPLTLIGHPSGLPSKIAEGSDSVVRSQEDTSPFFVAELDSFGGNSGSAVLSTVSGEVEGILVRGEADYEHTDAGCYEVKTCESGSDNCQGEHVSKISAIREWIKDIRNPAENQVFVVEGDDTTLPDHSVSGLEFEFPVDYQHQASWVSLEFDTDHSHFPDIRVMLTRPDGEYMVFRRLGHVPQENTYIIGFGGATDPEFVKFTEGNPAGNWKVKIIDVSSQDVGKIGQLRLIVKPESLDSVASL